MFAGYATHANPNDPLSALQIGEQPEPHVPEGWLRVKIGHASLNRHDLFTLRGISGLDGVQILLRLSQRSATKENPQS